MWDLKPRAPAEIRGPFKPIPTSTPGLEISEHLPRLARRAQHYALVRSVSHPNDNHTHMIYYTLTGRHMANPNPNDNAPFPPSMSDHPHLGSVVAKYKHRHPELPGYVALPELSIRMQPVTLQGGHAGFLGRRYDALAVNQDPRDPRAAPALVRPDDVTAERFASRRSLWAAIDGRGPAAGPVDDYRMLAETAFRMVGAGGASELFELDREPVRQHDRYGRERFGQALLVSRRLVEAGVSIVALHFNYMSKCDGWDTHKQNFTCLEGELLPLVDQGLSALLDDLSERGRLEETLVVVMGEFGRTPRINADAGRDHWGRCASVLLAGGGVRGGQVLGSSDRIGAMPASDPYDPADIQATIYHALGIDSAQRMIDSLGRPTPLSHGTAVAQLF